MKNIAGFVWAFVWAIVFMIIASACGGGGGGGDEGTSVTAEVQSAMDHAGDLDSNKYLLLGSGSIQGRYERMTTAFPEVETLMAGGSSARDAMLAAFTGNPEYSNDTKLAIFAYALDQMGDPASLPVLMSFLENNVTGDLYFTPQFVTRAIKSLTGASDADALFFYPSDMRDVLSRVSATPLQLKESDRASLSCWRMYAVKDNQGNTMTYVDDKGVTRDAIIGGNVFLVSVVSDKDREGLPLEVAAGGGTPVNDNPEFSGSPSGQFHCAGYAFRGINGGKRWRPDPAKTFEILTKTGMLVEVSESQARAGDKVFYFRNSGDRYPGHVAEVERVSPGIVSNTIIIRNADNNTGLWEAPIDAAYFTGSWFSWTDGRYPFRKVYRWVNGVEPYFPEITSVTGEDYCSSSSLGFAAIVNITGYSISFDPTTILGANNGEFTGDVQLTDVVGILASQGSGGLATFVTLDFDRRSISGGGTYSMNTMGNVFNYKTGSVSLVFASPAITNADDGSVVPFESTGGTATLTSWGTSKGDRLIGTYYANVSGSRTALDAGGNPYSETVTGTIFGGFNVEITEGN